MVHPPYSQPQPREHVIAGRFKVSCVVGAGNFAKVMRAVDMKRGGEEVAVKVLKKEYAQDAVYELDVLKRILKKDAKGHQKVTRLRGYDIHGTEPCFVFNLLGAPVRGSGVYRGERLASFAAQMAGALAFLHFECNIIHTDLKPENILFDNPRPGAREGWSICDFGSSSFFSTKPDSDLISTRPYRAPEAVLGLPWSYAVDIWSLGCILYELCTGKVLFETNSNEHHLMLMEAACGPIPQWLWVNERRAQAPYTSGGSPLEHVGDSDLTWLLRRCLAYDPATRVRADEILHQPFVARYFPNPPPMITTLPPSGYTSFAIRTPGTAELSRGARPDVYPPSSP